MKVLWAVHEEIPDVGLFSLGCSAIPLAPGGGGLFALPAPAVEGVDLEAIEAQLVIAVIEVSRRDWASLRPLPGGANRSRGHPEILARWPSSSHSFTAQCCRGGWALLRHRGFSETAGLGQHKARTLLGAGSIGRPPVKLCVAPTLKADAPQPRGLADVLTKVAARGSRFLEDEFRVEPGVATTEAECDARRVCGPVASSLESSRQHTKDEFGRT